MRFAAIVMVVWLTASVGWNLRAQDVSPTQADVMYAETAPEIDGAYDDVWNSSLLYEFPDAEGHRFGAFLNNPEYTEGPDDFWVNMRVLWDDSYLYVWVQARDQEPFADGYSECWRNDSIELLLDGGNEKLSLQYDANDAYLGMRLGGDLEEWEPNICTLSVLDPEKATADIVYATAVTDTGWVMEVRVPWANVDVEPANGRNIGFNVYANDADGRVSGATPQRDIQRSWAWYPEGNGWQNPASFGTLTFAGGPGGAVANASFVTDPQTRVLIGEPISFDASGSTAPGDIVSYLWDFGDGNTGDGVSVSHTYESLGRYIVTLSVEDSGGAQGTAERVITVWEGVGLPESPLEIPHAVAPPEIDGELDDVWANAQHVRIATRANGVAPVGEEDLSATARLLWDEENLYVYFDVMDDQLHNDSGNAWEDDSPEVYIDGGYERGEAYDDNDAQFELSWNGDTITGTNPGTAGAEYASLTNEGIGYAIEVKLPWTNVSVDAAVGTMIGLELMVNDDDQGGNSRETKIAWFAPEGLDVAFENPSAFGTAVLVDQLVSGAQRGDDLPDSFRLDGLYPNPFNPSTTAAVQVLRPGTLEIIVHDMLGRLIQRQLVSASAPGMVEVQIDLGSRASGLYFVSVRDEHSPRAAHATAVLIK